MNIPLLDRLCEMFGARKESRYANDKLAAYMFSFVKEGDRYDELYTNLEVRDAIEECQTYIFRDRPLQVNAIIEAELEGDYDTCEELINDLWRQDTATMCNLVVTRNYIYQS